MTTSRERSLDRSGSAYGCEGYVQIDATFYLDGQIVSVDLTNFTSLPPGSWVPFQISLLEGDFDSYDLLLSQANCS